MASSAYQISWKSTNQKVISEGRTQNRQAGDLISLLSFLESRLKITFIVTSVHQVKRQFVTAMAWKAYHTDRNDTNPFFKLWAVF
jgi:hypothetical protein